MPFKKGSKGNPRGRPVENVPGYNLPQLCRIHSKAAFDTIKAVMEDKEAPHQARIKAAEMILDRGFGKAVTRNVVEPDAKSALEMTRDELERIASGRSEGTAAADGCNGTIN